MNKPNRRAESRPTPKPAKTPSHSLARGHVAGATPCANRMLRGGKFVLVEVLAQTGVIAALHGALADVVARSPSTAVWLAGIVPAFACSLMNNLPVGLIA